MNPGLGDGGCQTVEFGPGTLLPVVVGLIRHSVHNEYDLYIP